MDNGKPTDNQPTMMMIPVAAQQANAEPMSPQANQ
jgi:hypothetical protein